MSEKPRKAPDISISRKPRKKSGISRLLPLFIIAAFALFILKEQVPAVDDKFQSIVSPAKFHAIGTCREQALGKSKTPQFARLIRYGNANKTLNGYFVDHIVVGELVPGEGESWYVVNCHIDGAGNIVNVHSEPYVPAPVSDPITLPSEEE